MTTISRESVDRLREIQEEIGELLEEALRIVKSSGDKFQIARSKSYWHPHIQMALSDYHSYVGKDGATLEGTINALEAHVSDEDDEEFEDESDE
jgi:hypothetical protein